MPGFVGLVNSFHDILCITIEGNILSACLESHLEGRKYILKKQNPRFVFGKKKKTLFVKFLALKNHFLEIFGSEAQSFIFKMYF